MAVPHQSALESVVSLQNHEADGNASVRLSDVLFQSSVSGFQALAPLPSNVEAIEAAMAFAACHRPHVAIFGPSGWGKSHLLHAANDRLTAHGLRPRLVAAAEWVGDASRHSSDEPLILDNLQDCLRQPRLKQDLRLELERRVRSGCPTLVAVTAQRVDRECRSLLPRLREWLVEMIQPPTVEERELIVRQMAFAENLVLSDALVSVLAARLGGDGRTLSGSLKRLRLAGEHWSTGAATLRALGLLNPFFADQSSWDLREHIHRTVSREWVNSGVAPQPISTYLMMRYAQLPEDQIALFYRLRPSDVYASVVALEDRREADPRLTAQVSRLAIRVVESLQDEN